MYSRTVIEFYYMKECKLTIEINSPVDHVFEFTTNPDNTSRWISGMLREESNESPPKIGTIYKNTSDGKSWDEYNVVELEENKVFTLDKSNSDYHVRYIYKVLNPEKTNLTYHEWVEDGEIANPFQQSYLEKLRNCIEESC